MLINIWLIIYSKSAWVIWVIEPDFQYSTLLHLKIPPILHSIRVANFGTHAYLWFIYCFCLGILPASGETWKEQRTVALSILRQFGMGKNSLAQKIEEEVNISIIHFKDVIFNDLDLKFVNECITLDTVHGSINK